jgi:acyl transferase domain-containing protein/acyl carrier protein
MSTGQSDHRALLRRALATVDEMQKRLDASERAQRQPIAIVGVGCRFPGGVNTPEQFWQLLREGRDPVTEVPRDRWDADAYYDPDPDAPGKSYTKWGAFLDNLDQFDPAFFGNAPREAIGMDPQHRLLLEVSWESLERAGYAPSRLAGSKTGVFIGLAAMDYAYLQMRHGELSDLDLYFGTGTSHSIAAGRLAYTFDFRGPAVAIDTACSSSLVAVHLACQSLRFGECDMALGGGVNVMLGPEASVATSRGRMMSFAGRCHTFDAAADGYVRAEGCGLIVLKRLTDAIADRDTILGVIHGSALNQDGRSNGLTAPNPQAQEQVIRAALADSGIDASEIGYLEAHGTGTPLGDPIEMRALGAVFGSNHTAAQPLMVGSVKTNIGHLEAAAGIAGLIKVILAMQHHEVPPHLHLRTPNPYIPWNELPITVPTTITPWTAPPGGRLVAGLSSFGFSGTNAHMILAEPPAAAAQTETVAERPAHVLTLSARTETALERQVAAYTEHLKTGDPRQFADVCFTAADGRAAFPERVAVVAATAEEAREKLSRGTGLIRGAYHRSDPPGVVFLFTGQGAQYAGMGRELYRVWPAFTEAIDRCAAILEPLMDRPLLSVLFPASAEDARLVDNTLYTQPALFALEYSLAQLWMSWGVTPIAVLGHSLGEYVAACVAGVFDLESALKLVSARARLMHGLPAGGAMAALMAPVETVSSEIVGTSLAIAAINGPLSVVISGSERELTPVLERFSARGVSAKRLTVSHAFHSPLMEPMLASFAAVASQVTFSTPQIDLISNVTGELAGAELASADYWARHIRQPVQFAKSMRTVAALGHRCFLEIGPAPVLVGMGAQCVEAPDAVWIASMRKGQDEPRELLAAVASLFVHGAEFDWQSFDRPWSRHRVVLPTYPFERSRYWLTVSTRGPRRATAADVHPLLGERLRSPKLGAVVFQAEVSADSPSLVSEHVIFDRVVLPASAYFEMAAAAGARVLGTGTAVTDVSIREPLIFGNEAQLLHTSLERVGNDEYAVEIHSYVAASDTWRQHVVARIGRSETSASDEIGAPPADAPALDADAFYTSLEPAGVYYGPRFRLLSDIRAAGGYATAALKLPAGEQVSDYGAHPAIVDAAFQLAGAALLSMTPEQQTEKPIYLPVAAARFEVLGSPSGPLRATVVVGRSPEGQETFLADVTVFSHDHAIVRVQGLSFKRATADALRRAMQHHDADALYEVTWRENDRPPVVVAGPRSWLVLADETGIGEKVATRLRADGDTVMRLPVRSSSVDDLASALTAAGRVTDIVHCWSMDAASTAADAETPTAAPQRQCLALVRTIQALSRTQLTPRLSVVTRGAQPAGLESGQLAVDQAAIWGLGRSIRNEHPSLQCRLIDASPLDADDVAIDTLVAELRDGARQESQVALRERKRLVPRLVRGSSAAAGTARLEVPAAADIGLTITQRGVLDNLRLESLPVEPPRAGEIQIAVLASGLNFRDVLSALGMYPGEPGPLGGEVVGTVVALGSGVKGLAIGDEVMALTPRGFCSRVNTSALLAWKRPAGLTTAQVATIPVVFQTAYYALHHLATMQTGERVLIHAGAGGVGMAAIQLAQAAGAEIFATAGTPAKRQLLRDLGVRHVHDSRSLSFADEIQTITGGEGVDIVLNSLAGEFITRSLGLLRRGGRFIELGKTDLWDQARASAVNPHARYTAMYLGDLCLSSPEIIHEMFGRLMTMFEQGVLRPLAVRTFAIDEAHDAFRYMAQARHIGKVVIEQSRAADRLLVHGDAAYLVTGGLGGVGLHLARWLAAAGARRLVLAGRRSPSSDAAEAIEQLRRQGTEVIVEQGDIAKRDDLRRMITAAMTGGVRLRGIVHAAGVLDDGMTVQQTEERFARVFAPKIAGASWIYEAAREHELDFVVFCSAGAALFGAPGQGNYAAANAFLDALAWQARDGGVPVLSVNWGAWRNTGMVLGVSAADQARWAAHGMNQLEPGVATASLATALRRGLVQAAILDVDWRRVASGPDAATPFFAELVAASAPAKSAVPVATAARGSMRQELESTAVEDRIDRLTAHVRDQVRRVLGLGESVAIRSDRGFAQLGMDSLMSVELSNRLSESLDCRLQSTLAFEHPTIEALTAYLANQVLQFEEPKTADSAPDAAEQARVRLLEDVERLQDDEVERSLAEELDRAGY